MDETEPDAPGDAKGGMKRALLESAGIAAAIAVAVAIATSASWHLTNVAYRGPGDLVPGATAFYGLRGYDALFARAGTNIALKLRRASDNTSANIAILRSGMLDMPTAAAFCAGTVCYVAEWYDQTGHGYNLVQTNLSQQPVFNFDGYGTSPEVQFDAASMTYLSGAFPWASGNATWSGQTALLSVAPTNGVEPIFSYGTAIGSAQNPGLAGEVHDNARFQFIAETGGTEVISGMPSAAPMALAFCSDGAKLGGYINGGLWGSAFNAANITGTDFRLGGLPAQANAWFTGGLGELILYPNALSADAAAKLSADERKFYGF